MNFKQKLELTWINKDQRPKLEPRVLVHDPALSHHAEVRRAGDHFDNRLIFGDNLLGLKALEQEFAGKVKCIFIDPPYNTGSAFETYDDGVEHSIWLSLIRSRLELIEKLLSTDGSLWITIDDNEGHYLKVLCDEIFGRKNFVASMVWEKDSGRKNDTDISTSHDYVLLYAKAKSVWKNVRNLLPRTQEQLERYQNPDNDTRGPWRQGADGTAKSGGDSLRYEITLPSGRKVFPPSGNYWRFSKSTFDLASIENRIYFGKNGDSMPVIKKYLYEIKEGIVPKTWWPADEVGSNQEARRDHLRKLLPDINPFETPKPERLLKRILDIATKPNDLVLDSFGGSGTTGAVAHKMGRRWIMIEMGEHCHTHIIPRMKKVIDGSDQGGISKAVGWKGGGGFRYYRLAPTLIKKDQWGNEVINPQFNGEMVAEAVCKLEGFTYAPSEDEFWRQGQSTENDFIYVTTQTLSAEQLDRISEEVGPQRSLLVCCGAWRARDLGRWANLSLKKIPKAVLDKADWDKDDYALAVSALPVVEEDEDGGEKKDAEPKGKAKRAAGQADLFEGGAGKGGRKGKGR